MTTALTFPNVSWCLVVQIEGFSHTVLSVFRAKIQSWFPRKYVDLAKLVLNQAYC